MDHKFPRTVAEFAAHHRKVMLRCERCHQSHGMALDVLDATFGPEFDLYAGLREMRAQLSCPACGAPRPVITFFNPEDQNRRGEVPFDEAVTHQLE